MKIFKKLISKQKRKKEIENYYWNLAEQYNVEKSIRYAIDYGLSFREALEEYDLYDYKYKLNNNFLESIKSILIIFKYNYKWKRKFYQSISMFYCYVNVKL